MNVIFYAGGEPIEVDELVISVNDVVACFNGFMVGVGDDVTPERLAELMEFENRLDGVLGDIGYQLTKVMVTALGVVASVKLDYMTDMTATIRVEKDCKDTESFIAVFDVEGKYKINQNVELMCDNGSGRELVAVYDITSDTFRVIRNKAIL